MSRGNPYEDRARAKKVRALVAVLEQLDQLPPPDDVATWPERTWELLAANAGIRTPSATTRDAVIAELRTRGEAFDVAELISRPKPAPRLQLVSSTPRTPRRGSRNMKTSYGEYSRIEAVNWSTLSAMRRSPLHYRHLLDHGRPDTASLALGRAGHVALFEPERFETDYVIFDGDRRSGKEWAAFKEEHQGKEILRRADYDRALAIAAAVRAHPEARRYLAAGLAEETVRWTDARTGLPCKGRIDWISKSSPAKIELKTARDIEMAAFARSVLRYGYHAQSAFYGDGWAAAHGEDLPRVIVAVESVEPFDVGVFRLEPDIVALGQDEYHRLLELVKVHRGLDTWPGRYPLETSLTLPPWAFGDDEDTDDLGLTDSRDDDSFRGDPEEGDPAHLF